MFSRYRVMIWYWKNNKKCTVVKFYSMWKYVSNLLKLKNKIKMVEARLLLSSFQLIKLLIENKKNLFTW